jgi:hypothetical protein
MAKGATLCCGVFSLLVGVELICFFHLLACIASIAVASSIQPIKIAGVEISPFEQIVNAAWALAGIPIIIGAGVGMLYRMESQLKTYFYYMVVSFFGALFWWMSFIFSGSICQTLVNRDVQRMGTAFVCGFTDTFVFFWMLLVLIILLYLIFMVWSAVQEVKESGYPNLMRYSGSIKHEEMPLPTQSLGGPPMGAPMSAPPMMGGMGPSSFGGAPMGMPNSAPPVFSSLGQRPGGYGSMGPPGMGGMPQSFVPSPSHY